MRKYRKMYNLYSSNRKRGYKKLIKMEKKLQKNISYILKYTDSAIFMVSSLTNLFNILLERIYRIKCKYSDDKEYETFEIKYKCCDCFPE